MKRPGGLPVVIKSDETPLPETRSSGSTVTATDGFRVSTLLRHPKHFIQREVLTGEEYLNVPEGAEPSAEDEAPPIDPKIGAEVAEYYKNVVAPPGSSAGAASTRRASSRKTATEPKRPDIVCELCKGAIAESSFYEHCRSVLHQFNLQHKTAPVYGLPESNVGYQMMLRGGWDEEKGLGAEKQGRVEPLKTRIKNDRLGLGIAPNNPLRVTHTTAEMREIEKKKKEKVAAPQRKKRRTAEQREKEKDRKIREALYTDIHEYM